jgi:PKD repeat protein
MRIQIKKTSALAILGITLTVILILSSLPMTQAASLTLNNGDSYDFSKSIRASYSGGDFYYTNTGGTAKFYANNIGQRGLKDLGDYGTTSLSSIPTPSSGFTQAGATAVVGHVYVSLAQQGEEGNYITFRVTAIAADLSTVTLDYLYYSTSYKVTVSPTSQFATTGQSVNFTATGSGGVPTYTYQWFEGTTSMPGKTSAILTVSKSSVGAYTYYCRLSDSGTNSINSDNVTLTVTASPPPNVAPNATFTYTTSTQEVNKVVSFDAAASSDSDGSISTYAWDFGDGSTGSGTIANHTYVSAGTYTVKLTITDNRGATAVKEISLTINQANIDFSISVSPQSNEIAQGSTSAYTVSAISNSSQPLALTVSGLPDGVTGAFNPISVNPNGTSTLNLNASKTCPLGSYSINITATKSESHISTTTTLEVVKMANPEFTLSILPPKQTIQAGQQTTYQINLGVSGGFNDTVTLSAAGLPTGASATFNPTSLTSGTSILTITTTNEASKGNTTLTITGTAGELISQTSTQLEITLLGGTDENGSVTEGFPLLAIIAIVAVIVVVVVIVVILLLRKRKPPAPAQVKITAEPTNIVANGENQAVITLQLLDKKGRPISAMSDTRIQVNATKGTLVNSVVTIPKGKDTEKTAIVSSTETGPVPISANADGLKSITVTLNFTERTRYCMHCGTMMSIKDKACKNCGRSPPAGDDTKPCQSCQAVIPIVAKFCSECGAGQTV